MQVASIVKDLPVTVNGSLIKPWPTLRLFNYMGSHEAGIAAGWASFSLNLDYPSSMILDDEVSANAILKRATKYYTVVIQPRNVRGKLFLQPLPKKLLDIHTEKLSNKIGRFGASVILRIASALKRIGVHWATQNAHGIFNSRLI